MQLYDPRADIVFRKIFGTHKNICISFLNALLPLKEEERIVSIEYQDPDVLPETPDLKNSVVDVRCTDEKGRIYLVEMQMFWTNSFLQRTLFNASKAYVAQSKPGMNYEAFDAVYSLCLLNENMPDMKEYKEEHTHNFYIQHENHNEYRINGMVFVFVELMKFKSTNKAHKRLAELWLKFLTFVDNNKEVTIPAELNSDPDVKSAVDYLERMHLNVNERLAYDKYWDAISNERSLLSGKITQGRWEEKKDYISEMHKEGFGLDTMARISRISVEEVKRILEEIAKKNKE